LLETRISHNFTLGGHIFFVPIGKVLPFEPGVCDNLDPVRQAQAYSHMNQSVSAPDTRPVIEVRNVRVTYPSGVTALHEANLSIEKGTVTVLLGPSGAGKSTLLRSLNLLVKPSAGEVRSTQLGVLEGTDTIRQHRRGCAMIFQQHQLIGRLTALQNVLTGRLGHHSFFRTLFPLSESERRLALACLDRVGLLEKALSRCDQLSGGQQQRVGIARALAQEPTMILADEPVASLDPASSERVLTKLRDVCREDGTPVVISLHQLDYAREFADLIVGLSNGRVVFKGAPDRLDDQAVQRIYQN
jgi:phosphonate transport system ATP-binding protein